MEKCLSEQQIDNIFERRGGFMLCAKYPSGNPSYDYISVGSDGVPNNLSYTVRVNSNGHFSLSFRTRAVLFAELRTDAVSGFDDDEKFARITEQFMIGVQRLEGFAI